MKHQPLTYMGPPRPAPGCGFKHSCVFISSLFFLKKLPLPPEKCTSFRSHKTWICSREGELGGKTELRRQKAKEQTPGSEIQAWLCRLPAADLGKLFNLWVLPFPFL